MNIGVMLLSLLLLCTVLVCMFPLVECMSFYFMYTMNFIVNVFPVQAVESLRVARG
jgi:hypothetical protein